LTLASTKLVSYKFNVFLRSRTGVSKSFRTGRLEQELQIIKLSATRCSCIAILWVSLVSFTNITLCVASQRAFIVVSLFFIDSVRKLLDTPSYTYSAHAQWWASSPVLFTKYYYGHQVRHYMMSGACSTHGGDKKCLQDCGRRSWSAEGTTCKTLAQMRR
jgi:hypothetical protein